jgi:mRNA interferase HigB
MRLGDPKARKLFPAWLNDVESADWKTPREIRERHRTADFLQQNRVVNI